MGYPIGVRRAVRCGAISSVVALVAALDPTYRVMRAVLTEPFDGPVVLILVVYPSAGTRALAVILGFSLTAAGCLLGSRVPGSPRSKIVFTLLAGAAVAVVVRAQGLSRHFEANTAFQRWILGLTVLLVAAAASAVAIRTIRLRTDRMQRTRLRA